MQSIGFRAYTPITGIVSHHCRSGSEENYIKLVETSKSFQVGVGVHLVKGRHVVNDEEKCRVAKVGRSQKRSVRECAMFERGKSVDN